MAKTKATKKATTSARSGTRGKFTESVCFTLSPSMKRNAIRRAKVEDTSLAAVFRAAAKLAGL